MQTDFYFQQLKKDERTAYTAMLTGFLAVQPSIRVLRLEGPRLADVFGRLKLDHPEIFWVKTYSYSFTAESDYVELRPEYLFEKNKIASHRQAVQARVSKLIRPLERADEKEKEAFIHRFICENVHYDKLKKEYSHEVIGPLTTGVGVCEGIAKTVKLLCDSLELPCIVVLCEADPEHGVRYRHAWNLIKTGGTWYHLDATFDLTLSACGQERFDYVNLCDEKIARDHRPSLYQIPACTDGGGFYYKTAGLSLTKPEDVDRRIRQTLRKQQPRFVFHWRGGYLTREVLNSLMELAVKAAAEKEKQVSASINFTQSVICFYFDGRGAGMQAESADAEQEPIDTAYFRD